MGSTDELHPLHAELERLPLTVFHAMGDAPVRGLLATFLPLTNAHEMAIWIKDPEAERLVPVVDSTGPGGVLEMKASQPLSSGIVSQVYRENARYLESGIWRAKGHSPEVDQALKQITQHEMCVPFRMAGRLVGVMSAVQLADLRHATTTARWGFTPAHLDILAVAAEALGLAMERAWLAQRWRSSPVNPPGAA